jgi:hypothetical protein
MIQNAAAGGYPSTKWNANLLNEIRRFTMENSTHRWFLDFGWRVE